MADISKAFEIDGGLTLDGNVLLLSGTVDPTIGGEAAPIGSVYVSTLGTMYQKTSAPDTGWQLFGFAGGGVGTVTSISVTGSTGLTVGGSPITSSGTISLTLGTQLQGLSALAANGIVARTASGSFQARTISGTTGNITVMNGDGVAASPVINLSTAGTAGTYASVTTDSFGRVVSGSTTLAWSAISNHPTTIAGYGILDHAIQTCADAVITSPVNNQILMFNGTKWVNGQTLPTSASGSITPTTSDGNNLYHSDFVHNLNTTSIIVQLYDVTTNKVVLPDSFIIIDANTVRVTVVGNTKTFRIVVIANGLAVAMSTAGLVTSVNTRTGPITLSSADVGLQNVLNSPQVVNAGGTPSFQQDTFANRPAFGIPGRLFLATDNNILYRDTGSSWVILTASAGVIQRLVFFANSLDSPNTADFAVNALAPTISDSLNTAMNVRSFSPTVEQGVSFMVPIPPSALNITFVTRGRAAANPGSPVVVQPKLYSRQIPDNGAIGAWSAATNMGSIPIPANTFFQANSQTYTLASLGLVAGTLNQFEFTRRVSGVTGGTNLPSAWLLVELSVEFS